MARQHKQVVTLSNQTELTLTVALTLTDTVSLNHLFSVIIHSEKEITIK